MSDLNHFIEEFKRQNQDLASDFIFVLLIH